MRETWVWSPGREDPLEEEMATHPSVPAWRIPWMEEPGGYNSWGRKESDTTEQRSTHINICAQFSGKRSSASLRLKPQNTTTGSYDSYTICIFVCLKVLFCFILRNFIFSPEWLTGCHISHSHNGVCEVQILIRLEKLVPAFFPLFLFFSFFLLNLLQKLMSLLRILIFKIFLIGQTLIKDNILGLNLNSIR